MYFYLKELKSKKKTLIYIKYYISQKEGRFVYSTKQKISPADWDFNAKNVKNKRGRTDLAAIEKNLNNFSEYLTKLISNYTLNEIAITRSNLEHDFNQKFNPEKTTKKKLDFFEAASQLKDLKTQSNKWTKNTSQNFDVVINNLKLFEKKNKNKIDFNVFTETNNFTEKWLAFCYSKLDHTDNTVSSSLSILKRVLLYAKKMKYHNIDNFSHLALSPQETDDVALSKVELMSYYNYNFKSERLEKARDLFCIGCFTGQRYSDYSVFDHNDYVNGSIIKRQKKTKARIIIPVDDYPKLKTLLEKYQWILPLISDQKLREYVKEGLKMTNLLNYTIKKTSYKSSEVIEQILPKWKMIGTHTARRTFVTLALEDGWTYKEIMAISGIKDVRTIMRYDKVTTTRLSKKIKKTFK